MRQCPECGNSYSDDYRFCPSDGTPVADNGAGEAGLKRGKSRPVRESAQISVRTLMLGLGILIVSALITFAAVFFYQYWKPKYGALVIKTTPLGAVVYVDGSQRGVSPVTIENLRSGGHQVKITKEGYQEFVQQVEVIPYSTENLHWSLEPLVPQLSNEQLAEVESLQKKLDTAQQENILFPPPDDYNVLLFANRILAIDPANSHVLEVKSKLAETIRQIADVAYAREEWLEAERQYKNLALLYPEDISINERIADLASKIDASMKDREQQISDWQAKAEAAMKAGSLVPPDKDNALEALRNIQRLDKKNVYAQQTLSHLKELLQNRGDIKITSGDWLGARADFRTALQYFPEDPYSKERLAAVEPKIQEITQIEQQRVEKTLEEQQSRQRIGALRQTALNSYRSGAFQRSISEWQEYLKLEPNSDEAYFYIAASYQDDKQLDTAILNFEKCLDVNPNHVLAHLNLGILYDRHRNDLKRAEEHLKRAKELGAPKNILRIGFRR
jgi:tetratricopeptide (TPR) repeat protein